MGTILLQVLFKTNYLNNLNLIKMNTYTDLELGWDFCPFQSDETISEDIEITKDLSHIELPF